MNRPFYQTCYISHAMLTDVLNLPAFLEYTLENLHKRAESFAAFEGVSKYRFESLQIRPSSGTGEVVDGIWIPGPPDHTEFYATYTALEMEPRT